MSAPTCGHNGCRRTDWSGRCADHRSARGEASGLAVATMPPIAVAAGINRRTSVDVCISEIEAAARDAAADLAYGDEPPSEDEITHDIAESMLIDADPATAREVMRVMFGSHSPVLERHLRGIEAADRAAQTAKEAAARERRAVRTAERREERIADRARAEAAEAEQQRSALRASTCPNCFTVRSPSGACNC